VSEHLVKLGLEMGRICAILEQLGIKELLHLNSIQFPLRG
jgi:hypothetical protein